jgi:asparagine synthase (glutamine-hydrolysing)
MCGIAGIYSDILADNSVLKRMLAQIRHRGPDDTGIYIGKIPRSPGRTDGQLLLGHNRLSIIDVTGGREPIYNETGSVCLVFNGEIYNYRDLQRELIKHHQFNTQTDAEVIVHLYEDVGPRCVEYLDGMFAFALFDGEELMLARDPLGIKPLYSAEDAGKLYFASEIKALIQICEGIVEHPAGHYCHTKEGQKKYFDLEAIAFASGADGSSYISGMREKELEEMTEPLRRNLGRAVEKRLMSDVPLGVFLSGGLDSSLIAALARPYFEELHSFSVGMEHSIDRQYARMVAGHLDTEHHELVYTFDDMIRVLPEVIYHLESFEPSLVRTAIPTYFVSQLASDYVKVVLSGEGSDELFSGYKYLKQLRDYRLLDAETLKLVTGLHNVNLQRVDRMTMAHSIEGRVPFLDVDFVKTAIGIPSQFKLYGEEMIEKWILRKAFSDLLPSEVIWRTKQQFASGAGSEALMSDFADQGISDSDFYSERQPFPDLILQSKEELLYYRIFRDYYGTEEAAMNVGRWRGSEIRKGNRGQSTGIRGKFDP